MDVHNKIADISLKHFKTLPKTGKPKENEWTVLSCIVMDCDAKLAVVSLGTGTKCIGKSKMCPQGTILNDSHAEIICRRSFLRYLYDQTATVNSIFEFDATLSKFRLKQNIKFHFFTTHVPCGDAAIFPKHLEDFGTVLNEQVDDDIIPEKRQKLEVTGDIFRTGAKCLEDEKQDPKIGGVEYHVTAAVRTKPGRGDSTLSVSCSDKLAKWCHLGIQGALLSTLLDEPIYLTSLTVTGDTPFCQDAFKRAIHDRFGNINLPEPYSFHQLKIAQVSVDFDFSKTDEKQPCPSSISWTKTSSQRPLEVAVDGYKQGVTKKKLNTESGRLRICKLDLFREFVLRCKNVISVCDVGHSLTYREAKNLAVLYQSAWKSLKESFKVWTKKDESLEYFKAN